MRISRPAIASLLLRLGIGVAFVGFGVWKFVEPIVWMGYIPPWMSPLIPMTMGTFIVVLGTTECILGALLILGAWTRIVAALVAIHLLAVIIAIGLNEIALRDAVILLSALALSALGSADCPWSMDAHGACTRVPTTHQ